MKTRFVSCIITIICLTATYALADEQPAGFLSDQVVAEKYQTYYKAKLQTFKRGKLFVTETGIPEGTVTSRKGIPKNTLIYPIRLIFDNEKHTEADLFFFQDEFGEWQVQRVEGPGFP